MTPALVLALGCAKEPTDGTGPSTDSASTSGTTPTAFPLPDDLDQIDFPSAFEEAVRQLVAVTSQQPFAGHDFAMAHRSVGCPDFWTGPFTSGGVIVSRDDGVAWNDDCANPDGERYDGWEWWDSTFSAEGTDPSSYEGRTIEGTRLLMGDATIDHEVNGEPEMLYEFDGTASDSLYRVEAYGYDRFVYSSNLDATVTGREVFRGTPTPEGYRAELAMTITGGDVDNFEARGDIYLFSEVFLDRFDSIGVDLELQGPKGAGPDVCTAEPLGWVGLRDANAYWYDVVFQPRFREDIVDIDYYDEALSSCDGCGKLYIQGVEQEGVEICVDFSFLFQRNAITLPEPEDYAIPWRGLEP